MKEQNLSIPDNWKDSVGIDANGNYFIELEFTHEQMRLIIMNFDSIEEFIQTAIEYKENNERI